MDEPRWQSERNVYLMIKYLRDERSMARTKAGRRKLRLFNVACFRLLWDVLDDQARRVVEVLEREAEGVLVPGKAAHRHALLVADARMMRHRDFLADLTWALIEATDDSLARAVEQVTIRLSYAQRHEDAPHRETHPELIRPWEETQGIHAALVREIFGNPFRPPAKRRFAAELRGLAQACYDDHSHYPLLADALADAGEDGAAAHCRLPTHVKGCHVVDWVLGRG